MAASQNQVRVVLHTHGKKAPNHGWRSSLVVCPAQVVSVWTTELDKWFGDLLTIRVFYQSEFADLDSGDLPMVMISHQVGPGVSFYVDGGHAMNNLERMLDVPGFRAMGL